MIATIILQSIADSGPFDGNALQWLLDLLVSAFGGQAMFGLLLGALIFVVFFVASDGSMATPTVALILSGTVIISMVPSNYARIAMGVVVIGFAGALWQVLKQYVLSGAVR